MSVCASSERTRRRGGDVEQRTFGVDVDASEWLSREFAGQREPYELLDHLLLIAPLLPAVVSGRVCVVKVRVVAVRVVGGTRAPTVGWWGGWRVMGFLL